jgi:hypothetical protein
MSTPFSNLSEDNHDQIRKYLGFFRNKKDGMMRTIKREIADVQEDRLNEDVYSKEDVEEIFDYLSSNITTHVSAEMGTVVNMGAVALNQLLEDAQTKGIELDLQTSELENQGLIEAIDRMSLDAMPRSASKNTKLTSFRDEAKLQKDEATRLEETNARLQAEVTSLRQRLSKAERNVSSMSESKSSIESSGKSEVRQLEGEVRQLERAVEDAKEEGSRRVSESPQFRQMQTLMRNQSSKMRDLRTRLSQYEPENVKEQDDDDDM